MKKAADFLVKRRYFVLMFMLVCTIASVVLMGNVNIISDMTEYLPDNSSMKQGIQIMEDEFPNMASPNTIRVMSTGLDEEHRLELFAELEKIPNIDSVEYEKGSDDYNKDNYALFVINTSYNYDSDEVEDITNTISNDLAEKYNLVYNTDETAHTGIPAHLLILALTIMMVILFVMCASWFEPLLFLLTIGIAVAINMGTNAFLSGVSETTYSIAAILQLVLSMDYSIILINRYRQELQLKKGKTKAMRDAMVGAASSIASSSLTTVVGLLALVFMSFKIGADLGIVLAKGVVISMICIFTVLPSLILLFDKVIEKTRKRILPVPMGKISRFSFKLKYVFTGTFVVFFVAVLFLKGNTNITYSTISEQSDIDKVFPKVNSIVLLYDNKDEERAAEITAELEKDDYVKSVSAYATTLGRQYTSAELSQVISSQGLADNMNIDASMLDMIYYDFYKGNEETKMTLSEFMSFIQSYIADKPEMSAQLDENTSAQLEMFSIFCSKEELTKERSATELSVIFGMDEMVLNQIIQATGSETISIQAFLQMVSSSPEISQGLTSSGEEAVAQMTMIQMITKSVMSDELYTSAQMAQLFSGISDAVDKLQISLLYTVYFSQTASNDSWTMSMESLFEHLVQMTSSQKYATVFDASVLEKLKSTQQNLKDGKQQLVGNQYSLMAITTTFEDESEITNTFFAHLTEKLDKDFSGKGYLIGNLPMSYEMSQSFDNELNKISLITILAIFIVVLFTFRSFAVPAVLVLVIQSAVYATMLLKSLQGGGINYLALLIVQSILMGATIDYAILFTSYYREKRKLMDKKEALESAYNGSIHTILTSGLIMILVTWILGYAFADPSIGQICHLIAMGVTCAILLIIFVLPGLISAFDRWTCGIKKKN